VELARNQEVTAANSRELKLDSASAGVGAGASGSACLNRIAIAVVRTTTKGELANSDRPSVIDVVR